MVSQKDQVRSLLDRYKEKIEQELGIKKSVSSWEYETFRKELLPKRMGYYEQLCALSEKLLRIKPDKKKEPLLQDAIETCHLQISPAGAVSFSLLFPLFFVIVGSLLSFAIFGGMFFIIFFFIIGISLILPLSRIPLYFAEAWRLETSNQMVLCIFYVVTYMRHTSNLENAIAFAAEHISPPLSLDLRKVLWDVETEKYESIKESLEIYLNSWKSYNMEFIESFHLIMSSLYEGSEERRLNALDKSLDVMLDGTYERMLHYAHNLKSPITMLHMMGVILPILGLVILPLMVSFLTEVRWYHIAALYNVALPIAVYLLGKNILSKRPTGYGQTDISEENPQLKKYKNYVFRLGKQEIVMTPMVIAAVIGIALFLLGISPILLHWLNPAFDIDVGQGAFQLLGYRESKDNPDVVIGPYGLGASILSLAVTLAFGLSFGIYLSARAKNLVKIREQSKKLEEEFASGLFQLANRLGDGLPAEIAVEKVAETMEGTITGNFFALVSQNVKKLGMSVQQAIFDRKYGALVYFPSKIIESSMKVLIESVKKGPSVAANALMNVSRYIKEIHKVNERLRDLMADIVASMTSQIKFMTPVIAGIVIGITSMITTILGSLSQKIGQISQQTGQAEGGEILQLFGDSVPTYYFQIIVGLYVVQIIYILSVLSNGIENGSDKLNERFMAGNNLKKSTILYCVVSLIIMVLFNFIAGQVLLKTIPGV